MKQIFIRSVLQIVRRPIYWVAFFVLPFFCFMLLTSLMEEGLPSKVPAAMIDKDGSALSRKVTQNLGGMQMVDLQEDCNSYTEARHLMQKGDIFGFFLIPENFERDLLSGRKPVITFYTNMTYFVPASILFKTFKTTALYTKAGVAMTVMESVGASPREVTPLLLPINIQARGIHNPELNYAIYLCNSFLPGVLELMIFLVTCFSLGQEIKYGSSVRLLEMANGSIVKALFAKLLPQTLIWWVIAIFLESWLFGYNGYPVYGSWFWLTLSELMFVVACQGWALFFFGILPNLRLSLSASALLGILAFSVAAFSFPVESMYGAISIFSWILPVRYNFLIYIDQALNGIDIYYSRVWFVAYIIFMILPFTVLWRIKREMAKPVYAP
ncbi:MAG: ABC transporter permease [Muribaculaceae bacterium]|nr:ABC transporter permease [Muribaculaceae bacterium]